MNSILDRQSASSSNHHPLNDTQRELDSISENFVQSAIDPLNLLTMTTGSFVFRFAKAGIIEGAISSHLSSLLPRVFTHGAANILALCAEVTTVRGMNQLFQKKLNPNSPSEELFGHEWLLLVS